jgi:hypothetical protein
MQTYSHLKKKTPVVHYFGEGMLPHISTNFQVYNFCCHPQGYNSPALIYFALKDQPTEIERKAKMVGSGLNNAITPRANVQ